MDREYEFFVTTDEPHHPEGPERGLIRRLVMKNFFEARCSNPTNNTSELNSASTVQAKPNLKSRFRLPKSGQEIREPKAKAKCKATERTVNGENGEKKKAKIRKFTSRSSEHSSDVSESNSSKSRSWKPQADEKDEEKRGNSRIRLLFSVNPSTHRFDPFDVLPVPGTPQLDMLFKLHKHGSRTNSIAINARKSWWAFISNDAGLLHAALATWALYATLVRGMSDMRVEKLRHKNEAIKEINSKIGDAGGEISDELVGTVLTLANFENLLGAYEAAQLHITALKRMVNARGGLFAFGHNDGLIRGIIWVDFHTAAAFHAPPSFPQINLDPDTPPLPEALLEEAACTSPTSFLQLSLAAVDCFNIFYRLHRLSLAISTSWFQKVDRLTISDLLYEVEYSILSVPDYCRDFLDFDLGLKDDEADLGDYGERSDMADSASVVEAILAATQIFIYIALRDIPPKVKLFRILLDRLRLSLDRPGICILDIWRKERNLNILLWVLVIASFVAPTWGGRSWWISRLGDVAKELGVHNRLELQNYLQKVAWTDVFFGEGAALDEIWDEASQHMRMKRVAKVVSGSEKEEHVQDADDNTDGDDETINSRILDEGKKSKKQLDCQVEYERGRWKVNGWYV